MLTIKSKSGDIVIDTPIKEVMISADGITYITFEREEVTGGGEDLRIHLVGGEINPVQKPVIKQPKKGKIGKNSLAGKPAATSEKVCKICGEKYKPTSNSQVKCPACKWKENTQGLESKATITNPMGL